MKKAFTMLELVFVIVVIGILSATMIPNMQSDKTREAAIQLVSHIRYTQHLAMVDDKYGQNNPTTATNWFKRRWQILFSSSADTNDKYAYTIFSDNVSVPSQSKPNHSFNEIAKDPSNKERFLTGGYSGGLKTSDARANSKLNLGSTYGITDITFTEGCSGDGKRIAFDHLGRPFKGTFNSYTKPYMPSDTNYGLIQATCNITLVGADSNVIIEIEPETGYAHIKI